MDKPNLENILELIEIGDKEKIIAFIDNYAKGQTKSFVDNYAMSLQKLLVSLWHKRKWYGKNCFEEDYNEKEVTALCTAVGSALLILGDHAKGIMYEIRPSKLRRYYYNEREKPLLDLSTNASPREHKSRNPNFIIKTFKYMLKNIY